MTPECQTLFSLTLFLALSSLLAWTDRRHRAAQRVAGAASLVPGEESVEAR
jgi:hypothetical protein